MLNYLRDPKFYGDLIGLAALWGTLYVLCIGVAAMIGLQP